MPEQTLTGENAADRTDREAESRLLRLARLAAAAGAERIAGEAEALAERVAEGRFYVACLGQFKRGKSSLLNALVGESVLPVGVIPITSVVTVIRYGRTRAARVRLAADDWQTIDIGALGAYVTETENPENTKGVQGVEVLVPSPLLASGMCLVDTPGIGSVFAGNTEATRAFVPHIDAALVVLGADPPISGEEAALVAEVAQHVHNLLIVLNKADRLTEEERREARAFAERVLAERAGRPVGPVREVSATERLAGVGPPRDFPALVAALEELAREAGGALVRTAEERGLGLLARRLCHALDEERDALVRPLEESERRLAVLRECVAAAQRSMNDLGYLFAAEEARLAEQFARQAEAFLARARPEAQERFRRALDEAGPCRGPKLRHQAHLAAQAIAQELVDAWLPEAQRQAEGLYVAGMERFVELANEFLERLASSGEPGLAGLPHSLGPESGFRARSRLFYTYLWGLTTQNPLAWLWGALRTRQAARRIVEREVGAYLDEILATNTARVKNDFNDRVLESRRRLGGEIDHLLREVYSSAERALAQARERRAAGSEAVQHELERIGILRSQIEALTPQPPKETTR
jgi:GTP-binding protein EngB required for normal cell division